MARTMGRFIVLALALCVCALFMGSPADAKKVTEWDKDPKHCEVCVKVMSDIEAKIKEMDKPDRKNKEKIENLVARYCSRKKNKKLGKKEEKLCYYIKPIKREVSTPFALGANHKRVCKKLERKSAEVCTVKYKIKTQGEGSEPINYKKMRVKHLKQILRERGVQCVGCVEKRQFVKRCQETEHLAEM